MLKRGYRCLRLLMALVVASLSVGCASAGDQRVNILYQRGVRATGGSGDLYLVGQSTASTGGATTIQWVIGEIRGKDGKKLGNTVTDTAPADTLWAAYTEEFNGAGYNTVQQNSLPKGVAKGVVLQSARIMLNEVKSQENLEATCRIRVRVEPWRDGVPLRKVEYEAEYNSAFAVTERDQQADKTLDQAIRTIMLRSVPDIIQMIEHK